MAGQRVVNHLRVARAEKGWSQAELAIKVSVSRKTINTIENGHFVPSTELSLKLAEAFGKRVEDLFQLPED